MYIKHLTLIVLTFFILTSPAIYAQDIPPMLSATYNQDTPYNDFCPDHSLTGCGPTAIAQILKMYQQPSHGFGHSILTYNEEDIEVDLSAIEFDWANMLDSYADGQYDSTQAKAVAELMYACGVAMNVQYGSSTAVRNYAKMIYGLQNNLHLSPDSRYMHRKFYSTEEWIEILNSQLRNEHPVFYRGTCHPQGIGHMFVIDGLNEDGEYHVNWGHSGRNDKFVDINALNERGDYPGGTGISYNSAQAMVINCFPTPDFTDYPIQACISEEPIILNRDIALSSITLPLGEEFTLSCRLRNYCKETATINFGWALIDNGTRGEILGQGSYGLRPGNTFKEASHRTIKLPDDLKNGLYELRLYSKSNFDDTWREVWQDAPVSVEVFVTNGEACITVPCNRMLNPELYLTEPITDISDEFTNNTKGHVFLLNIANPSDNNFENKLRLEINTANQSYNYETTISSYSHTTQKYAIPVPQSVADIANNPVTSIKASYYYDIENRYICLEEGIINGIYQDIDNLSKNKYTDIYTISGLHIFHTEGEDSDNRIKDFLSSQAKGVYILKTEKKVRKISI